MIGDDFSFCIHTLPRGMCNLGFGRNLTSKFLMWCSTPMQNFMLIRALYDDFGSHFWWRMGAYAASDLDKFWLVGSLCDYLPS